MRRDSIYNNESVEFTIYEDYAKEKFMGTHESVDATGNKIIEKTYKETWTRSVKSKIRLYPTNITEVRTIIDRNIKTYKKRCLIKTLDGGKYVVASSYNEVNAIVFQNSKQPKIGFK